MNVLELPLLKVYANRPRMNSLVSEVSIKTKTFALETIAFLTCRLRSHNCVMQKLQSYRCI